MPAKTSNEKDTKYNKAVSIIDSKTAYKKTQAENLEVNLNRYKRPEPWVELGKNLFIGEPSRSGRAITIGIDFGTAFTKASVGMIDKVFIVNWSGTKKGQDEFMLPGMFSILGNGRCVLGHAPTAKSVIKELKKPFLTSNPTVTDITNATIFLALVLRYIRGWIYQNHAGFVTDKRLIWSLNIGIPSKPFENQKLQDIYKNLALRAWLLSYQSKAISLNTAIRASNDLKIAADDNLESIDVIPEFVAQIASYIRSPQRQQDLHMIMDIGAGTVDVATFNVWQKNGEDVFPIFSSMVEPLGTHYLMQKRFELLKRKAEEKNWDDFLPILSAESFSKQFVVRRSRLESSDDDYANQVTDIVKNVLYETKFRRYPLSKKWESGIRLFFCGGGSECEVFSKALDLAATLNKVSFRKTPLPFPGNLEANGLKNKDYHRVAVAYGLGIFAANLGKIIPASDVPDIEVFAPKKVSRPDRDELYAK